jgi:hypothetical protein
VVQAGAVSPGASGSPALPQVTEEEEEEEGNAGDPIEGDDAIAQMHAAAKARADAAAAIAIAEAAALQANAAKEKAQTQATQVHETTKTDAPPEGQLESTEKEVMPAVTVDMAAPIAMMQSMQQDNDTCMPALQATATGSDLCGSTQIESAAPTTTSEGKYALTECGRACGTLSDLCGSTQIDSAAPTTTSEGKYAL